MDKDKSPEDRQSPDAWAAVYFPRSASGRLPTDYWKHTAAASRHQWPQHAHHAGSPKLLSREDYVAALHAATTPDKDGHYTPHAAALSDYAAAPKAALKEKQP